MCGLCFRMRLVSGGLTSRNTVGAGKVSGLRFLATTFENTGTHSVRLSRLRASPAFWSCHIVTRAAWISFSRSYPRSMLRTPFCFVVTGRCGISRKHLRCQRMLYCFIFPRILRRWIRLSKSGTNFEKEVSWMKCLLHWTKSLTVCVIRFAHSPPPPLRASLAATGYCAALIER